MKKQQVKAVSDIILNMIIIPKGSIGYRSRWSQRLKRLQSTNCVCVRFPDYQRKSFVAAKEEVINID